MRANRSAMVATQDQCANAGSDEAYENASGLAIYGVRPERIGRRHFDKPVEQEQGGTRASHEEYVEHMGKA